MLKKKEDNYFVKQLINLFKPYRWKVVLVISLIIISSGLSILNPLINQHLIDEGLISKNLEITIKCSIYSLILILTIECLEILETKYRSYIENLIVYDLENKAFKHILKMKMEFFVSKNYSELMSNLKMDINNISGICNRNTFYILTSIFRVFVGIIGILSINYKLSILVIAVTPMRYAITKFLAKKRKSLFREFLDINAGYSGWYGDTIAGIKEVKLLGLQNFKRIQLIKRQKELIKQNIKLSYMEKANEISETISLEIVTMLIYIIGGYMIAGDVLTIGQLIAFISYSSYVTQPIFAIMNISYTFSGVSPSAKRYFDFLENNCEVDCEQKSLKKFSTEEFNGSIEFKNVSFNYNMEKQILKNISFKIKAGEKVAIIGSNGSGKTTIANLLLRFLNPTSGTILIDGQDVNSLRLKDYRKLISVVSQDIYLFNTTIKDNILLNSKNTEKEMKSLTKKIGAYEFIEKMPDKYDSIVGERGSKLSGGEKQKIAMVRAFMRNAKILLLDEATANCDIKSEGEINNIISEKYNGITSIIITHRPQLLNKVDKIIVINNGIIEDIGNSKQMYERNKFYRNIINSNN
ncbi:ABC transporter ATP-binding protein [Clostridium botulinum]|uniref:ABC transporter ATP-binding protein n=1 Tax=Clostridium botulinum TaxID=1491 RepID=UPI0014003905|nr:ABC transporter ATP-binding protein [Clostridium botulinum]MBY6914832.1 ABC transporter ATP-binding protein [Clostridium botulinum]NFO38860.1 ABC transporter ATP-binding protein [Clostridium botulinum]NFQ39707.1 ABC transporter ATP-binding protein [Clostridium botulinum]